MKLPEDVCSDVLIKVFPRYHQKLRNACHIVVSNFLGTFAKQLQKATAVTCVMSVCQSTWNNLRSHQLDITKNLLTLSSFG
jgi:hypothetical protein